MANKHDQAIQKFGELTSAYKKLQAKNKFLRESIKTTLNEINGKLNIDTLALNLTNELKPLFESNDIKVNYETIKQKCKEALEETQDFLDNILADVDELLKQLPPPSS
ncbi:2406_t:CDS:1 [Gigaspora margarita]|uniref:2406_t:CDS:1 n=1 Tax=Gigaspora margarita TaxID=4874 RepID=A0ABN7XMI7_GIGMA|nr:2406_t:CDS:1 [Gigaspora margarita]